MGAEDMKRMCKLLSYIGEIIDYFVKHRGCLIGNMRAHDQLPSSRGLSVLVGAVLQGDIFFVEADVSKHLVPILLAVCEASLFMYLYVFVDVLARAQGRKRLMVNVSEMQRALEDLTTVCTNQGHPIHELRFDRESAISGTDIGPWLKTEGIDRTLTGAGQKLGLAEVNGRIFKNRCRSTLAGIHERFEYRYPAKWIPRLAADVVYVLNWTHMRAPFGEILFFKRPKRTASSPILEIRAE
jgi:hypothetical protein